MQKVKSGLRRVFFKDLRFTVDLSVSVRWLVAAFLFLLTYVLPAFNQNISTVPILLTGILILVYNSIFFYILKIRHRQANQEWDPVLFPVYRAIGLMQIIFDYVTLVIVLYFIGGLHTSLFYIIVFHLIIGSIILTAVSMYIIATCTIFGFLLISLLELMHVIPFYNLYNQPNTLCLRTIILDTAIHSGIIYSIIIVVSRLTARIRNDNITLARIKIELEDNLEAIKALELRKSKFMRYSAHQLRSPLATVISALNVIVKKLIPPDSQRAMDLVVGAKEKTDALLDLVKDLLGLSRIREARKNLEMSDNIDLVALIEEIVFSFNIKIEQKRIEVVRLYRIGDTVTEYTQNFLEKKIFDEHMKNICQGFFKLGNRETLKEALINLIHNAINYTHEDTRVAISAWFDDDECGLSIRDQGIGIEPEYIDDIFLEFVRSPNAKNYINEGSGLGLSIAREVIEAHNGTIKVVSGIQQGAEFIVHFSREERADEA